MSKRTRDQIPEDARRAIEALLRYNWDDEVEDYSEQDDEGQAGHILNHMVLLRNWLHGTNFTAKHAVASYFKASTGLDPLPDNDTYEDHF